MFSGGIAAGKGDRGIADQIGAAPPFLLLHSLVEEDQLAFGEPGELGGVSESGTSKGDEDV